MIWIRWQSALLTTSWYFGNIAMLSICINWYQAAEHLSMIEPKYHKLLTDPPEQFWSFHVSDRGYPEEMNSYERAFPHYFPQNIVMHHWNDNVWHIPHNILAHIPQAIENKLMASCAISTFITRGFYHHNKTLICAEFPTMLRGTRKWSISIFVTVNKL